MASVSGRQSHASARILEPGSSPTVRLCSRAVLCLFPPNARCSLLCIGFRQRNPTWSRIGRPGTFRCSGTARPLYGVQIQVLGTEEQLPRQAQADQGVKALDSIGARKSTTRHPRRCMGRVLALKSTHVQCTDTRPNQRKRSGLPSGSALWPCRHRSICTDRQGPRQMAGWPSG